MFFGPEFVKLGADFLYEIAMLIFIFASAFFCIALGADFLYEIAMLIFIFASAFFLRQLENADATSIFQVASKLTRNISCCGPFSS